jgi:hypothetical protein
MDKAILILAARLLRIAAEEFQNNGCNDLPSDFFDGIPDDQKAAIVKQFHNWIDPELEFNPNDMGGDDSWMDFLADKLDGGAKA